MAEQLLTTTIQAPGFMGLNTQDSSVGLDAGFATIAENCIIDKFGRIGSRQGWTAKHVSNGTLSTASVQSMAELIDNAGTSYVVVAGNNALFTLSGATLTAISYDGGGTAPTISDNNWQMAALNGCLYLYQVGHDPLVFEPAVSTSGYRRIAEKAGYVGTIQNSNCVVSAYGRTWSANTSINVTTVQFSDLLAGHVFSTGTAGTLDISSIWPSGADEIIALKAHNGYLYIFGRRQILIYQGAADPATMSLADAVSGIGCLARDSVVVAGGDIIFLSDNGIRSMLRTIQEKSAPMRDISTNVRDGLVEAVDVETAANIKAIYSDKHAFYLLSLPVNNVVYCFDMRQTLQNGASRVTIWTNITPKSFLYTRNKDLLIGQPGFVGIYGGYYDNTSSYRLRYYTNYFDFQSPTTIKILKKVNLTFVGGNGADVVIKYGFDYIPQFYAQTLTLGDITIAEYGIAEYDIGYYTAGIVFDNKKVQVGGSGNVIQLAIETIINGAELSLQKLDCYVKNGRTR